MTRRLIVAVIGGLLTLGAGAARADAPRGRLEWVGTNVVAFGEYPNTEDRTAVVTVRNGGSGPLNIARVVLTCKCMRVVSFPQKLAPGETGDISVMIVKNEVAGRFERVFYVESDGESGQSIKARITGNARPLFLVTCDKPFALGPVDAGTAWTGHFTMTATEPGIRLGPPTENNQGTTGTFAIRTNRQDKIAYEVDRSVTFDGEGLLESTLTFPVLRDDGEKSLPVRLTVEAVRRRPFRVVPDQIVVSPGPSMAKRRILVSVESPVALDASKLTWTSEPEAIDVRPALSKSGKAFMIDIFMTPERQRQLDAAGKGEIRFSYCGGHLVDVPLNIGK